MNEIIYLVIVTLATFGLSSLIADRDGPAGIFLRLRKRYPNSPFHCTVCTATWVAIIFFIVLLTGFGYCLTPLAIVGVVILLERI